MKRAVRVGRWLSCLGVVPAFGLVSGCLTRPVGTSQPTTKTNFTAAVAQARIDKVDLLFAIDNSASMLDKQKILTEAVPRLLDGLLKPDCVDGEGQAVGSKADPAGTEENHYGCPKGSTAAFKPVTDLHIGVISSSLGAFGQLNGKDPICPDAEQTNDNGRLLSRGLSGNGSFLAWYPPGANTDKDRHPEPPASAVKVSDSAQLSTAFASLVGATGQGGCGLEAQLESVYRFLIQPDPWKKVTISKDVASIGTGNDNIDTDLLKQRAEFLRPDSLVAVIMLTDEDDSFPDPLSYSGRGYKFSGAAPMWKPTKACAGDPGSKECTSCPYDGNDPNCTSGAETHYTGEEDLINARFFDMKRRYGVDPQFPLQRYIDGFTKPQVPDRSTEHVVKGGIPGAYVGTPKCTNPLFAAKLPGSGEDYCDVPVGTRSPSLVYFAVIGGAPNDLVDFDSDDSAAAEAGWTKLLGKDPDNFDPTGISPYMVQSKTPRKGLPGDTHTYGENGDDKAPVGRDYDTGGNDLQYACTFALPDGATGGKDCTVDGVTPPLCDAKRNQIRAKAYPTIREFRVVKGLGPQGIVASLCPKQLTDPSREDYGYNPAVASIATRLKNALSQQCLPRQLTRDADNEVPCLVLAKLPEKGRKCADAGLKDPPKDIVDTFRDQERAEKRDATLPVCEVPQKAVAKGESCKADGDKVWCYVESTPGDSSAGKCSQAIIFSQGTGDLGTTATFSLQCIQQSTSGEP